MIISIAVRDLSSIKHQIDKYALITMQFKEKNNIHKIVQAAIIRKIYLIENFKINLLINNDIFDSKLIDILASANSTYIENCEIIIFILIKIKSKSQQLLIYIIKTLIVIFEFEFLLDIHKIFLFDRDYFFEFVNTVNFSIYAHVVDSNTKAILVRNENIHLIKIFRNFELNVFNEMNCLNVYLVDFDASDFAIKSFKKEHKDA